VPPATVARTVPTVVVAASLATIYGANSSHYLRRSRPDCAELYQLLRTAAASGQPVPVTETLDTHEIVDVRANPRGLAPNALASGPITASPTMTPVSLDQAYQMFNLVRGTTCCPSTVAAPCIPP